MKTKTIFKISPYYLLFIPILFSVWFGREYFFDEDPDPGRDKFYSNINHHIPDQTNVAVAISGINAPIDVDIIKFGRSKINDFYAKNDTNSNNELNFIGIDKLNEVDCILQDAIEVDSSHCTTLDQIDSLITRNNVLLNRYYSLYKIMDSQSYAATGGQTIINLNKLVSAQIKLLISQKKPEEAYQLWRDNHVFISRILGQEITWVATAIFLVVDGRNLSSLEDILYNYPYIGFTYQKELNNLLAPKGLERFNIKGKLRAEYHFFNEGLFKKLAFKNNTHVEYIRNRLYRTHINFLNSISLPPKEMSSNIRKSKNTDNFFIATTITKILKPHGFSNVLASLLIDGMHKGELLVKSMHAKSAFINLLHLSLSIRQQNITKENIQTFLDKAGKEYECPFTEKPMVWNSARKTIYCENPEEEQAIEVRL
jgi:hypothetical protein